MAKKLNKLDLQVLTSVDTAPTGFVAFAAKSDGLYQKVGTVESKLSTTAELLDRVKTPVPSGAKFTDTNTVYTHPTSAGNKHIPTGGATNQILRYSASGTAVWSTEKNTTYGVATTSANGLMSYSDKSKLNGIAAGANKYSLPTATASVLGGIKVGSRLSISSGTLSANVQSDNNFTSAYKTKLDGIATGATKLSLGTTSATAYRGDRGNTAYNHSQATGNPHGTTASLVGAYTKAETNSQIELSKSTNHGYRYKYTLQMYGDHNKYYPFVLAGGDQNVKRDILIKRSYSEKHPPEWYSSTHGGGLTLKLKANFGGWGGANYGWEIHELEEMYNPTFGGCSNTTSNMTFSIMLRGGGTGGAIYHIYSDQPIENTYALHLNGDGKTSSNFPQVFYNKEVLQYTTTTSKWTMPTPLTTPRAEDIRRRKFIKLVQDIDTLVGKTTGTSSLNITGNAATATKLQTARTIGGVSFNGSANINLPGVNTAGNQNTSGTAAKATTLATTRAINGTNFNGSAAITTARWGTARNIGVVNSDGTGTAVTTSVNGSANVNLRLPSTIKASLTGNASSATKLSSINTTFTGTYPVTFNVNGTIYSHTGITYTGSTGELKATKFVGALSGNASSATNCSRSVVAGNGLTGGGALTANRTVTLGTPGTLSASSKSAVSTSSHTHLITTTTVGAANTIIQTDAGGNIVASGEITAHTASDKRLKKNITNMSSSLDILDKLRPVSYNWNDKAKELNSNKTDDLDYGLIAQEVEEVLPEIVHNIYEEEYKSIDYLKLVPLLVGSVKELKERVEYLEKELKNK